MMGRTGVIDANSVIGLVKGNVFDLLPQLFATVSVPPEVAREVIHRGQGRPGALELAHALGRWAREVTPDPARVAQFAASLSRADREVLAVAAGDVTAIILTDDRALRREASRHHLVCVGIAEVVVGLKEHGLIMAVQPVLDRMRQAQFGIAPAVYEQALRAAGEAPTP
jgi:predicted nucleic acid-binding protein